MHFLDELIRRFNGADNELIFQCTEEKKSEVTVRYGSVFFQLLSS
jgi:hypothetical protein